MADISVTTASVAMVSGGKKKEGIAGGTITQGQPLYRNTSNRMVAAQANAATTDAVEGIALNAASSGQPVEFQTEGLMDFNAVLLTGKPYMLSAAAAGGIAPAADLVSTNYGTMIGIAVSTSRMRLLIGAGGLIA